MNKSGIDSGITARFIKADTDTENNIKGTALVVPEWMVELIDPDRRI
jgi:hypothetical protein